MWSIATLVTNAQSGSNTLTASSRPPRPTSRMITSGLAVGEDLPGRQGAVLEIGQRGVAARAPRPRRSRPPGPRRRRPCRRCARARCSAADGARYSSPRGSPRRAGCPRASRSTNPCPLVPPTVITTASDSDRHARAHRGTRSSPSSMRWPWRCSSRASQPSRLAGNAAVLGHQPGDHVRGLAVEHGEQHREAVAQLAAVHDQVDRALLEQELGALEAFRQLLAHGLLDHARAGEADQRVGLGDDHVAHEGKARRHAAHGGVGEQGDEGQPALGQAGDRRGGLGHLHQREQAFLHARATRGGDADEGQALLEGRTCAAHEALAHHRAHRAAEEVELEAGDHHRQALDRAAHHHHRVGLAGVGGGRGQAVGVLARVLELERIDRRDLGADLDAALACRAAGRGGDARAGGGGGCTSGTRRGCCRGRSGTAPTRSPRTCSTALRGSTCCATNRRA